MTLRLEEIEFIEAANYTPVFGAPRDIRLLVLHTMESQEKPGTARNVARWFAGDKAPQASAHYCVDNSEVIRCVRDEDVAWHAPGANKTGIGIEHAGRASQTATDWMDLYSKSMLKLSVELAALLCIKHDIPAKLVTIEGLLKGQRGITTHVAVTRAFKRSSHTDPGPGFPLSQYIKDVERAVRAVAETEGGKS